MPGADQHDEHDRHGVDRAVVEKFRAGGEIEGMHRDRLLLLTTTGRRSGRPRTTPMMFVRDGDVLCVFASNNGAEHDPDWYENLLADASVIVEVGDERFHGVASTLRGAERERVWDEILAVAPFFGEHQARAGRQIPVVALNRVESIGESIGEPAGDAAH